MNLGSSPAVSIFPSQYIAASGSDPHRVVVSVFLLVVPDLPPLDAFLDDLKRKMHNAIFPLRGRAHRDFERGQRMARIAVANRREEITRLEIEFARGRAVSPFRVRQRPFQKLRYVVGRKRVQLEDERARGERRVDEEVRIVRRRSDEDDCPVLDVRKENVLLRLVEAVYLVDEENRSPSAKLVACPFAYLADVCNSGKDAGEPHEVALRRLRDDFCKRCLSAAGRSVQDYVR